MLGEIVVDGGLQILNAPEDAAPDTLAGAVTKRGIIGKAFKRNIRMV